MITNDYICLKMIDHMFKNSKIYSDKLKDDKYFYFNVQFDFPNK